MKTNNAESIEDQEEVIRGIEPHPEFETCSDSYLELRQGLIDQKIAWAKEDHDDFAVSWYEIEMALLQAERARRNGGVNSLLSPKGDIGKAKHFRPLSASELLNREVLSIPYVLDGYIPKGVLALLIAYMKTGKSTLVYRMVVCIAKGIKFLKRQTEEGGVLVLAVEEHPRDVERRLRRFGMTENDPIYIHIGPVQEHAEALKVIKDFIIEKKIILVVVDSLSRFWKVQDENNNMEVIREVSPLLEMARETNAAVLLVHHERKSGGEDGKNIRGGSALFGLVDQAIFLERRPGEVSNKRVLKTLGRYEDSPPELIIELVGDDYNVLGTPEEFGEIQAMEKVKSVLTTEPADLKTIAKEADTTEKLTRKVLEILKEHGEAERTGGGKKGDPYLYCLFSNHNSLLSQCHPIGKETNPTGSLAGDGDGFNWQTGEQEGIAVDDVLRKFPGARVVSKT